MTVHFVNERIDDGKIICQEQSNFEINDNTYSRMQER